VRVPAGHAPVNRIPAFWRSVIFALELAACRALAIGVQCA